jgi:hypothetical protein
MSLFDEASLIVTPNAFKASKLYSIKPTDGSGDLSVVRATTATRVNSAGLIETVSANIPRLDYTNGSCPSILIEPQRTNLATYSEQFDNAYWLKTNAIVTGNNTNSPSGTLTADKLTENITNSFHYISLPIGLMSTQNTYTFSCFLKGGERNWANVYLYNGTTTYSAYFNLSTGQKGSVTNGATSTINSFSNGWYRCTITLSITGSVLANGGIIIATDDQVISYPGTNGSGFYIWGAQLEAGANATSYIPTVASAVTRNADVISKTGISDLIGQTEGTINIKLSFDSKTSTGTIPFALLGASNLFNNSTYIQMNTSGTLAFIVYRSSTFQLVLNSTSVFTQDQVINVAVCYKQNDFSLYINGVMEANSSSGNVSLGLQGVSFGINNLPTSFNYNGIIKNVELFKERLTNQQMQDLTTL